MDVTIRTAKPHELDFAGELTLAAYRHDGLLDDNGEYAHELRDAAARSRDTELLVAIDPDGGDLLGTVTFCLPGSTFAELARPGEAEFRMLAVGSEARGRGVGEALVRACLDRARANKCQRVVISTRWDMRPAHRLYQRLGFVREPSRDWWPVPEIELICYIRELDTPEPNA